MPDQPKKAPIIGAVRRVPPHVGGGAQNCGVERQRARLRPHLGVNRVTDDRSIARIPSRIILPGTKQFAVSGNLRSEEHTSELQSLMRISYAVFCLKKNTKRM